MIGPGRGTEIWLWDFALWFVLLLDYLPFTSDPQVLVCLINLYHWEITVLCWVDWVNTGPGVVATKQQEQGKGRDTAISYSDAKSPGPQTNGGRAEPWAGWVSALQRHPPHSHHPEEVRILLRMPLQSRHPWTFFSSYALELGRSLPAYIPLPGVASYLVIEAPWGQTMQTAY